MGAHTSAGTAGHGGKQSGRARGAGYERHYTIYYYDMVKKMATTAIDSTPSERHLGLPILPLDDKVVYIMLAPGRSGLYYAPVVR